MNQTILEWSLQYVIGEGGRDSDGSRSNLCCLFYSGSNKYVCLATPEIELGHPSGHMHLDRGLGYSFSLHSVLVTILPVNTVYSGPYEKKLVDTYDHNITFH